MKRAATLLLLGLGQLVVHAQALPEWTQADVSAERARIEAMRMEINAKYDAADQACKAQFVVMACVNEVRLQRIADLAALRRKEVALNDIVRQQTAAEQKQRLAKRQADRAAADAKAASEAGGSAGDRQAKTRVAPASVSTGVGAAKANPQLELSPAQQAENRAAYQQKLREAEEKKRARDERLQSATSTAKPLPIPP